MRYEIQLLPRYDELQRMTDEEVAARYTRNATAGDRTGKAGVNDLALTLMWMNGSFYLDELARRATARANDRMERMTKTITRLTRVITVLTFISVVAVIASIVIPLLKK